MCCAECDLPTYSTVERKIMVRLQSGRSSVPRTRILKDPWTLTLVNMSYVGSDMYP
jgi:hypothetical protein